MKKYKNMKKIILIAIALFSISNNTSAQNADPEALPFLKQEWISNPTQNNTITVEIVEKTAITFENFAQVFFRFKDNSLTGKTIQIFDEENRFVTSKNVEDKYLFVQVSLNKNYTLYIEGVSEPLTSISTVPFEDGEMLELSQPMFAILAFDESYRSNQVNILEAMDANLEVSYFEKLKFIQQHFGKGASINNNFSVATSQAMNEAFLQQSLLELLPQGKTTDGLDPNVTDPIFADPLPYHPCDNSLAIAQRVEISRYVPSNIQVVPLPFNYYDFNTFTSNPVNNVSSNYEEKEYSNFKGASCARWFMNHGWSAGGSHPGAKTLDVNDSNASHQSIMYTFAGTSGLGYDKEKCGCKKRINFRGKFESWIFGRANTLGAAVNTNAAAQGYQYATIVLADANTGNVTPFAMKASELNISCGVTLNPDFVKTVNSVASETIKMIVAVATAGGSSAATIGAIKTNGTTDITNAFVSLFTTDRRKFDGFCGTKSENFGLFDITNSFELNLGDTKILTLTSGQSAVVSGKKHWQSEVGIDSRAFITTYLHPEGTGTGTQQIGNIYACCSKKIGQWLQTGHQASHENQNKYEITNFLYIMGIFWDPIYTLPNGDPYVFGNFGKAYGPASQLCSNPITLPKASGENPSIINDNNNLLALVPNNWIDGTYQIVDVAGKSIKKGTLSKQQDLILDGNGLPAGMYIIKLTKDNETLTFKNMLYEK